MINVLFAMLLLQSVSMPPRASLQKPAPTPAAKSAKDYDKVWTSFVAGANDARMLQDAEKLLKKEKSLEPSILTIKAYLDLYRGDNAGAERQFEAVLALKSEDRIALRYLGDMAFDRADFARASALYSRLVDLDESVRPEIEPRRQKAILMAAENLLRLAAEAEKEGRAGDAERLYRDAGAHPTAVEKAPEHAAEVDTDAEARRKTAELEDLGRWGGDIGRFRKMEASETITREEFAALVVRYFPDLVEFRQTPRAATDISNSWAAAEIQTVLGLGITDLERDSEFNPTRTITRGALCQALSSLAHIVGVFSWEVRPDPLPDVAFGDPLLGDAQWALASGLLVADKSGELRPHAEVSGREAVIAVDRLASELRKKGINTPSFQQQP